MSRARPILRAAAPGAAAGLLLTLAYSPCGLWWLAWVALLPLYVAVATARKTDRFQWPSAVCGYAFGLAVFLVGAYWMLELGTVPWFMLALIEASPYAVVAALLAALLPRLPAVARPWVFAAAWALFEMFRSSGAYAFPWFILATTQTRCPPMIAVVALTGQWGLSFLIAAVNGLLGEAWLMRQQPRTGPAFAAAAAALLCGIAVGGYISDRRTADDDQAAAPDDWTTIGVAQGAFDKGDYGDPESAARVIAFYGELSRRAVEQGDGFPPGAPPGSLPRGIGLVVWPETVVPGVYSEEPDVQKTLAYTARGLNTPLLAGVFDIDTEDRWWNSAVLYGVTGARLARYDKNQIVPIGEFFPLRGILGPIYARYGVPTNDLTPGSRLGVLHVSEPGGRPAITIGALICYESVFPRWAREETRQGAQALVLLTSDETFGTTAGPTQHADIAPLRAVETHRWLVRAAATGESQFIDPSGRVRERLPLMRRDALAGDVRRRTDQTLYVRFGDWFLWVCGAILAVALAAVKRRSPSAPVPEDSAGILSED